MFGWVRGWWEKWQRNKIYRFSRCRELMRAGFLRVIRSTQASTRSHRSMNAQINKKFRYDSVLPNLIAIKRILRPPPLTARTINSINPKIAKFNLFSTFTLWAPQTLLILTHTLFVLEFHLASLCWDPCLHSSSFPWLSSCPRFLCSVFFPVKYWQTYSSQLAQLRRSMSRSTRQSLGKSIGDFSGI